MIAALAWANRLGQETEGRDYEVVNAYLDWCCCGAAGTILTLATLAVLGWPKESPPEATGGVDWLFPAGFIVIVSFAVEMIIAITRFSNTSPR